MKKKFSLYLLALILMVTPVALNVSAEEDPFANEIVFFQDIVEVLYEDGEMIGDTKVAFPSGFGPQQRLMSETENSEWTAHDDSLLTDLMSGGNVFRLAPYTYYGSFIRYKDGSKEVIHDKTISFGMLRQKEQDTGKRIQYVQALFGAKSKMTVNYNLVDENGNKTLLSSDVSYGKFDLKYNGEIDVKADTNQINNDIISKYILANPSTPLQYKFSEEDSVVDIDLKLPTYTVNFVDEAGNKLKDSLTFPAKYGEAFKYVASQIKGYTIKSGGMIDAPYSNVNQEFTVVYVKDEEEQTKPVDPVKPVEPVKPVDPEKPVVPVKPTEKPNPKETLPSTGLNNSIKLAAATFIITGITFLGVSVLKKKEL